MYEPVLLANIHKEDSHTLAVYEAGGGYRALRRVLKEMTPADVVAMVRSSNLRGRGGAGFPTGLKWSFLPEDHPGPIYLCVNADESEPGTFYQPRADGTRSAPGARRDHPQLLRHAGHHRLHLPALRVSTCACQRMQAAIDECYAAGYFGKNILGSGFSLECTSTAAPGRTSAARKPG